MILDLEDSESIKASNYEEYYDPEKNNIQIQ